MKKSAFNLNQQNNNVDSRIVAALERVSQAFRVLLWNEGKENSLSPIQVQVLIFLLHHSADKRKVSYLADEFNMTKATISETIKSLDEKKLVIKEYSEKDTRSYTLHLTSKGKALAIGASHFAGELQTPIHKLTATDKESLLLNLLDIIRHLNQQGIITIQRMCFTCVHHQVSANGKNHFCKLLNQKLAATDLRIDCPEHSAIAG